MLLTNILLENCSLKLFKVWLTGYLIGVVLAVFLVRLQEGRFFWEEPESYYLPEQRNEDDHDLQLYFWNRDHWIADEGNQIYLTLWPPPALRMIDYLVHINKGEDRTVAKAIAGKVRVSCIVMTTGDRHKIRARLIKQTWGSRCDKLLFMSTVSDDSLPAVALRTGEDDIWNRDKEALRKVYLYYSNEADWFIRTNDETYVIIENLKYMLKNYSSSEAVYFGCMPEDNPEKVLSSNAYVFSKEALKIFGKRAHTCNSTADSQNIVMEKCLHTLNITLMDSRDAQGRGRFFPSSPPYLGLFPSGAADYAISFHKITDNYLYLMEFFVYHLRPFGVVAKYQIQDSYIINDVV